MTDKQRCEVGEAMRFDLGHTDDATQAECDLAECHGEVTARPFFTEEQLKRWTNGAWKRPDGSVFRAVPLDVTKGPEFNKSYPTSGSVRLSDRYLPLDAILHDPDNMVVCCERHFEMLRPSECRCDPKRQPGLSWYAHQPGCPLRAKLTLDPGFLRRVCETCGGDYKIPDDRPVTADHILTDTRPWKPCADCKDGFDYPLIRFSEKFGLGQEARA